MNLSPSQIENLKSHLSSYGLGSVASLLDDAKATTTDFGYSLDLGNKFLDTDATIKCLLVKNSDTDFLFYLIAETGAGNFSAFFPQMLPSNPWGISQEDDFPFPHLAFVTISKMKWIYFYCPVQDAVIRAGMYAKLPVQGLSPDSLAEISDNDAADAGGRGLNGGLFYTGQFNVPWEDLIPSAIPWKGFVPEIKLADVRGCIYHEGVLSRLKLQIPLASCSAPFGSNIIKETSFVFELSSPLVGDKDVSPEDGRKISLSGKMQIGSNAQVRVAGIWPLDGDDVVINGTCKLKEINNVFSNSSISGITLPEGIEAMLAFDISKKDRTLQKVSFLLDLAEWNIAAGIFSIPAVHFGVRIFSPGSLNMVMADFNANAKLGSAGIICYGRYPDNEYYLGLDPTTPVYINDIIAAFHGTGFNFTKNLVIEKFSGNYNRQSKYLAAGISIADTNEMNVGDTAFKLNGLEMSISGSSAYIFKLEAAFSYTCQHLAGRVLQFSGGAEYDKGWAFNAMYSGDISLKELGTEFGFAGIPDELNAFTFKQLSFGIITGTEAQKFFSGNCSINILGTVVDLSLLVSKTGTIANYSGNFTTKFDNTDALFNLSFLKDNTSYVLSLQMMFQVSGANIGLEAEKSGDKNKKISELRFSGGARGLRISFSDLLKDLVGKIFPDYTSVIPADFIPSISLTDIYVTYDGTTKEKNLVAFLAIAGKEVRFFFQHRSKTENPVKAGRFAFGLQTDITDLSGIPLVGGQMGDVKINKLGFVYASFDENVADDQFFMLPELSGTDEKKVIVAGTKKQLTKGITFSGELSLPGRAEPFPLSLPVSSGAKPAPPPKSNGMALQLATNTPSLKPETKWFAIDKKIGPLSVAQVGFQFEQGKLGLLLSGQVSIAALTLGLNGLAVKFVVSELLKLTGSPEFDLGGINIMYSKPPVEVTGMLMRSQQDGHEVYTGAAVIKASKFTVTGIGSYAKVSDQASLFVYGMYEGAIGGPTFFFVTALAAGFGYNRKVNIPAINDVALFPLVALAMRPQKKKLTDILADLEKRVNGKLPIEISMGDYWLAVGIRFTSFKIIESFVLVTVNFGTRVEFALIGLSRLTWPEKSISATPIVYIELALLAHFGQGSDVISTEAVITPNSYLLSEKCKLSGGFAFYTWVSGPHEGDFVVTLGGYHPKFKKPAHYPSVPRLSLNWKVNDRVTVKGEMYYAITPSAIMAGGKWEVIFEVSVLTASVTVWADMLITWAPFRYYIDMGICVRIEADIKIVFVHVHFSLEMGAELHIWGPEFAGEAYVDWVIFSFTIPFGSSTGPDQKPIGWDQFATGFVPQKKQQAPLLRANNAPGMLAAEPLSKPDPINITVSNGIIDVKGEDKFVVINAHELALSVESFIPVTNLKINETNAPGNMPVRSGKGAMLYSDREKSLGVRPCGLTAENNLAFNMKVTVSLEGMNIDMKITGVSKGVSEALWGNAPNKNDNKDPGTSKVIPNVLSGLTIHAPDKKQVATIRSFDFSKIYDFSDDTFVWQFIPMRTGEAYHEYEVLGYNNGERKAGILETTYNIDAVRSKRQKIASLLKDTFDKSLPDIEEDNVRSIMNNGHQYFTAAPVLCKIGEMPQYPTDVHS